MIVPRGWRGVMPLPPLCPRRRLCTVISPTSLACMGEAWRRTRAKLDSEGDSSKSRACGKRLGHHHETRSTCEAWD